MRIIEPVEISPSLAAFGAFNVAPIGDALVVKVNQPFQVASLTTNVPETDYSAWGSTTPYAIGARVMLDHHNYEALVAHTGINPTGAATAPPTWLDLGMTNRWRMFDDKVGTFTSNPESVSLTIVPGRAIDSIAFFGVDAGSITIRVIDPYRGIVFESEYWPVSTAGIYDWYDYLFRPVELTEDFVVPDVPAGAYSTVEVIFRKAGGVAKVGALIIGKVAELGVALYGSSVGITDYSRKERDAFGNFNIVERGFSKRAEFDVSVETMLVGSVQRTLAKYRAKAIVWIGEATYESTIIYGYYREFNLVISGPTVSDCSISVEGLN